MAQTILTLYSRQNCHLCEQAKDAIIELKNDYHFKLEEIDIDQDDDLTERYGLMIPVLFINDEEAGFGQINKMDIKKRLQKEF